MVMQLYCKFLKDYSLIMDRERFLWRGLGGVRSNSATATGRVTGLLFQRSRRDSGVYMRGI
jgi:hypothetical protein